MQVIGFRTDDFGHLTATVEEKSTTQQEHQCVEGADFPPQTILEQKPPKHHKVQKTVQDGEYLLEHDVVVNDGRHEVCSCQA